MSEQSTIVRRVTVRYTRKTRGNPVKIRRDREPAAAWEWSRQQHQSTETTAAESHVIDVAIDVSGLIEVIAGAAAKNRSGRAKLLHGLVAARRVTMQTLDESTREIPLPDGYVLDTEATK